MKNLVVMFAVVCAAAPVASAQRILVQPYLQQMTPTSVWILWETDRAGEGRVDWGESEAFGQMAVASSNENWVGSRIHEVQLTGLQPETSYYYRVRTGNVSSAPNHFHTPALQASEASTHIAVVSDMQRDGAQAQIYRQILNQGIAPFCREEQQTSIAEALSMVLIPGDLVPTGLNINHWRDYFFADSTDLMGQVPFYPVLGNHENNTPFFYNYFHLPTNGSPGHEEQWWWFDQSNLRIIGLDSNGSGRGEEQLTWLSGVLDDACSNELIDFVFAQLHHPHHSELWIAGNTAWTGEVIDQLEQFSSACGKPSVHFYGHTHGYSRGQSQEHNHTMVNAASAGGRLDRWGEYAQVDYPEYSISTDDYGFVHVDVQAGDDPQFRIRRLSWGVPEAMSRNELTDELLIRKNNQSPQTPSAYAYDGDVSSDCFTLAASEYREEDGDEHGASHWQVAEACNDFSAPLVDRWRQSKNIYFGVDRLDGIDLTQEQIEGLEPERSYCWRVRYRDSSLGWSEWSEPEVVWTGARVGSGNLLINGDAEQGTQGWESVQGPFESLTDGECNGVSPFEGERYFAIGGLCDGEVDNGEARQRVDVSDQAESIDAGDLAAHLEGYLRDFNGSDEVALSMVFWDADGGELGRPDRLTRREGSWARVAQSPLIPVGTRSVDVVLTGTRRAGTDNDSYADALRLRLAPQAEAGCQEPPSPPPPAPDAGPAPDAAPESDAGIAPFDAGNPLADAGPLAPPADAGLDATPVSGCGCAAGTAPSMLLWCVVAGLRRRQRASRGRSA